MYKFDGFDLGVWTFQPLRQMIKVAKLGEKHGADTFWIGEQYHDRSGMIVAAAAVAETRRIKIGFGIISPFTRHPALIAMETGTLDEYSNGRVILGLGSARLSLMRHGMMSTKTYTGVREAVGVIRGLMRGDSVTFTGEVFRLPKPGFPLGFKPRREVPIYIGGMGPRMFRLAGMISDGLILGMFASPGLIRFARKKMEEGAKMAKRDPSKIPMRSFVLLSVDRNRDKALEAVRKVTASYLSENLTYFRFKQAGFSEEEFDALQNGVRKRLKYWAAGDMTEASKVVTDDVLDRLTVAGTPDDCVEKLEKWADAGLNYPFPSHVYGPEGENSIPLLFKEVVPHLVKR